MWVDYPQTISNTHIFGLVQGLISPLLSIDPVSRNAGGVFLFYLSVQSPGNNKMPYEQANDDESLASAGWHFEMRQLRLRTQPKSKPEGEGQALRHLKVLGKP